MTPIVPKTCFQGHLGDVSRTSWGRPKLNFQGRPLDVRLGRPRDIISRRPPEVRSGRPGNGQIGSLGDVLGTLDGKRPRDVLGTNTCRLGL